MWSLFTQRAPLPPGAEARRELCFEQAVIFIEDAIKVGSARSRRLGPGSSGAVGLWGLDDGCPDGPLLLAVLGSRLRSGDCVVHVTLKVGAGVSYSESPLILCIDLTTCCRPVACRRLPFLGESIPACR